MYQQIIIAGYLGRDPEMRYTESGTPVTNFSVATTRRWSNKDDQQQEETAWFRISAWGRQAEVCNEYLSKGRPVLVEGRLIPDENGNPRIWTGNDGEARASFEVRANTVRFLGSGSAKESEASPPAPADGPEEEIPF